MNNEEVCSSSFEEEICLVTFKGVYGWLSKIGYLRFSALARIGLDDV